MTQGLQQGPLDRPVPHYTEKHWWNRIGTLLEILRRIDQRMQDANSFKLAIDEKRSAQGVTSLTVPCQTMNPSVITGFIVVSPGAAATVTIGDSIFPVAQGTVIQTGLCIIRREQIDSTLTTGVAGNLFMEVFGYEQPRMAI